MHRILPSLSVMSFFVSTLCAGAAQAQSTTPPNTNPGGGSTGGGDERPAPPQFKYNCKAAVKLPGSTEWKEKAFTVDNNSSSGDISVPLATEPPSKLKISVKVQWADIDPISKKELSAYMTDVKIWAFGGRSFATFRFTQAAFQLFFELPAPAQATDEKSAVNLTCVR